ncbi:MAG: tRNA (N6-threonylcarbamoyladenosine(37)-N6)-methyltransferase TrmO [Candidatus Hermodarchaeota archaeon]
MKSIHINPIGFVKRSSSEENERDRSLITKIIINKELNDALDGIEDFSHVYIIFWLDKVKFNGYLHRPRKIKDSKDLGVFATRAPIRPNPNGLTLVKLIKREENNIWVEGLDALDNTPVLDIKPYPDWDHGMCIVITDFEIPDWIKNQKKIKEL